jgi:hypothetical protein
MLIARDLNGAMAYIPADPIQDTKKWLNVNCYSMVRIHADGDELARCCQILGRPIPDGCYSFMGDNAKEIAANW